MADLANALMRGLYGTEAPPENGVGLANALQAFSAQPSTANVLADMPPDNRWPWERWAGTAHMGQPAPHFREIPGTPKQTAARREAYDLLNSEFMARPEVAAAMAVFPGPGRMPPRIPNPIHGYHGSPHNFVPERLIKRGDNEFQYIKGDLISGLPAIPDGWTVAMDFPLGRFDLSKINTGEGSQSRGHGSYIAENPSVGGSYRLVQNEDKPRFTAAREGVDPVALDAINRHADTEYLSNPERAIEDVRRWAAQHGRGDVAKAIESLRPGDLKTGVGHLYEVDIHAEPGQLIDYDKPLSGQSEAIRAALNKVAGRELPLDMNGQNAWERAWTASGDDYKGAGAAAAKALGEAGVPGLRYLDQGSRGRAMAMLKEGKTWEHIDATPGLTRNFVIWRPEILDIIDKYGLAGPIAAGILASQSNDSGKQ